MVVDWEEGKREGDSLQRFSPPPAPLFALPRRLYFVLHLVMTSSKRIHPFLEGIRKDTTTFIEENPI